MREGFFIIIVIILNIFSPQIFYVIIIMIIFVENLLSFLRKILSPTTEFSQVFQ